MDLKDLKEKWDDAWQDLIDKLSDPFKAETMVATGNIEAFLSGEGKLNWDSVFEAIASVDEAGSKVRVVCATKRDLLDGDSITLIDPTVEDFERFMKIFNDQQAQALEIRQRNMDWIGRWIDMGLKLGAII